MILENYSESGSEAQLAVIRRNIQGINANLHIIIALWDGRGFDWRRIIRLKEENTVLLQDIHFANNSFELPMLSNMEGLKLASINADWEPFVTHRECASQGRNCSAIGLLPDIAHALSHELNFSINHVLQKDGDWGLQSISGSYNLSGNWPGVMGAIVQGKFPLCLNGWSYTFERHDLMDFVPFSQTKGVLVLTPQPAKIEMGLFYRPFSERAWNAIFLFVLLCGLFSTFQNILGVEKEESSSLRIVKTSLWVFFVLVSAYYSGALTMFFSTEIKLRFKNFYDVINAYPDWKLVRREGS